MDAPSPDQSPSPDESSGPDRPPSGAGEPSAREGTGRSGGALRQLTLLLLGAGMIVFVWINSDQSSTVDLLFWQPRVRTALLILVPLVLGVLLGWLQGRSGGRRRKGSTGKRKGTRGTGKGRKHQPR